MRYRCEEIVTPEERVIQLERQLIETRSAATNMIVAMSNALARTPDDRERLARSFDAAARDTGSETARLARLVAAALRQ